MALLACLAVCASAAASSATTTKTTKAAIQQSSSSTSKHKISKKKGRKGRRSSARSRGQKKIDGERAEQIQEALIREHYLSGKPSGVWDQATEQAMQRYQADHGWQTKTTPDSRALIRLGLGPDNKHLLNPESAMTAESSVQHKTSVSTPAADPPNEAPHN